MHERTLRIVYRDKQSIFKGLLKIDSSTAVYVRNLRYLMTEIFNVKKGISPSIINDVFEFGQGLYCNLRSGETLKRKMLKNK